MRVLSAAPGATLGYFVDLTDSKRPAVRTLICPILWGCQHYPKWSAFCCLFVFTAATFYMNSEKCLCFFESSRLFLDFFASLKQTVRKRYRRTKYCLRRCDQCR